MRTATPTVKDAENDLLLMRVQLLDWGITLVAGVPGSERTVLFTGANHGSGPRVRTVDTMQRSYRSHGAPITTVAVEDLAEACGIVTRLETMQHARNVPPYEYRRLLRGFNAFVAGLRANVPEVRLHQFVRSVEALLSSGAWGRNDFVDRARDLVREQPDSVPVLRELYQLRNVAEHHGDLDRGLPNVPRARRLHVADHRIRQAEAFARALYRQVFSARSGYMQFFRSEESITRFWSERRHVRRAIWGEGFDLLGVE